jgi:hypothetical protein
MTPFALRGRSGVRRGVKMTRLSRQTGRRRTPLCSSRRRKAPAPSRAASHYRPLAAPASALGSRRSKHARETIPTAGRFRPREELEADGRLRSAAPKVEFGSWLTHGKYSLLLDPAAAGRKSTAADFPLTCGLRQDWSWKASSNSNSNSNSARTTADCGRRRGPRGKIRRRSRSRLGTRWRASRRRSRWEDRPLCLRQETCRAIWSRSRCALSNLEILRYSLRGRSQKALATAPELKSFPRLSIESYGRIAMFCASWPDLHLSYPPNQNRQLAMRRPFPETFGRSFAKNTKSLGEFRFPATSNPRQRRSDNSPAAASQA